MKDIRPQCSKKQPMIGVETINQAMMLSLQVHLCSLSWNQLYRNCKIKEFIVSISYTGILNITDKN